MGPDLSRCWTRDLSRALPSMALSCQGLFTAQFFYCCSPPTHPSLNDAAPIAQLVGMLHPLPQQLFYLGRCCSHFVQCGQCHSAHSLVCCSALLCAVQEASGSLQCMRFTGELSSAQRKEHCAILQLSPTPPVTAASLSPPSAPD